MIWQVADWTMLLLQLVCVYFDYNSTQAGFKRGTAYETIPLTAWYQAKLGKWWGLAQAATQLAILTPGAYFASHDPAGRCVYPFAMLLFQGYYWYAVILPNYKVSKR